LQAQYVIHTVGPVWGGETRSESELLKNCYENSLKLAAQHGVKTLAFPSISTGVYRYPKHDAILIALQAVNVFLENGGGLEKVILVFFSQADLELCQRIRDKNNI